MYTICLRHIIGKASDNGSRITLQKSLKYAILLKNQPFRKASVIGNQSEITILSRDQKSRRRDLHHPAMHQPFHRCRFKFAMTGVDHFGNLPHSANSWQREIIELLTAKETFSRRSPLCTLPYAKEKTGPAVPFCQTV